MYTEFAAYEGHISVDSLVYALVRTPPNTDYSPTRRP